jgi:glycosyltransferase involved in cell wall biosynthesis
MQVLMITSEWPTSEHPEWVPFLVREVDHLRKNLLQLDLLSFRGGMNPVNYLKAWKMVQYHLNKQNYDLIHAQFGQSGLLAILPKRRPLVVTFRGSDLNGIVGASGRMTLTGWLLRRLSQLVSLRAEEIILVSKGLASSLPRKEHHLIPTGIDLSLFKPLPQYEARQQLNLSPNSYYVLFAGGRNNPIKRYSLAQEAISVVVCHQPLELLVVKNEPPDKMPLYMNAADVLLLTSSREGSPNVVIEALACNLPVVAVDVGDVRERLGQVDGCIVTADNHPQTIAAALQKVIQLGERVAGRDAVRHLDIRTTTRQIINVYHQALNH